MAGWRKVAKWRTARSRLRVRAVPAAAADRVRVDHGIRAALRRDVEATLDVDVEFVERLPRGARAKVRAVEPLESEPSPEPSSDELSSERGES